MWSVDGRWGKAATLSAGLLFAAASCAPDGAVGEDFEEQERPFASDQATLLVLSFDGELVAPWSSQPTKYVKEQLFYTVGQLNGHGSVGQLHRVEISDVKVSDNGDGRSLVRYRASLPVGWGADAPPSSLELVLPRRITPAGLSSFAAAHAATCVDAPGDHAVTPGNYWYHYRPEAPGCVLAAPEAMRALASVTVSEGNSSGELPELHHVWADNTLRVVAVFGKYQDGATDPADPGIAAYDDFLERLPAQLGVDLSSTAPPHVPLHPGTSMPDVGFEGRTEDGRAVQVTALLIDSPKVAGPAFDARYAALTREADLIVYDGHAGLGANVHALAQKGSFLPRRWQLFFVNGCDTFAYLDDELAKRRALLNPDDPSGTKYMDVLTNLMPAYFSSMPSASLAVMRGLLQPRTYTEISADVDPQQVVVVTGEQDNVFDPAWPPPWPGLSTSGALGRGSTDRFETPVLPPGRYRFELRPEPQTSGGDADLYVGLGFAPDTTSYSFAPYLVGSDETVEVELEEPTRIHLMVRGYHDSLAPTSKYRLRGLVAD